MTSSTGLRKRKKLTFCQFKSIFNLGPGCSSFDGALLEIGPVTVQGKGDQAILRDNPGKWNEYANVLFVDQPAGTGYSYINKGHPVRELGPVSRFHLLSFSPESFPTNLHYTDCPLIMQQSHINRLLSRS